MCKAFLYFRQFFKLLQTGSISKNTRGSFDYGWLKTNYSFSFSSWYDPQKMGWGKLRVINDDWIMAQTGFDTHGHRDMEIVTIVLEGAVSHKDSMGNTTKISAGEVQIMSAGTGVMHSEHNKEDSPLKLLQIWIEPKVLGIRPRYDQKQFFVADKSGKIYPIEKEQKSLDQVSETATQIDNQSNFQDSSEAIQNPAKAKNQDEKFEYENPGIVNTENENLVFLVGPKFKQNYLWINQNAYMCIATGNTKYQSRFAGGKIYILNLGDEIEIIGSEAGKNFEYTLQDRDALGLDQENIKKIDNKLEEDSDYFFEIKTKTDQKYIRVLIIETV
jgi:hypothetical protein